MTRWFYVLMLGTLLFAAPALAGETIDVLPLNSTAYSTAELATLLPAIERLETLLGNPDLASRRYFASNEWQSRDFAEFTSGRIAELLGVDGRLVSAEGWPDGRHTWVLVAIPTGQRTAWIPVEASPASGHAQVILGTVPGSVSGTGRSFDAKYRSFSMVEPLPADVRPVAKLRAPMARATAQQSVTLLAIESYDPDGEIVLYVWEFGDGHRQTTTAPRVDYMPRTASESLAVSLTVVDNCGRTSTVRITIGVVAPGPQAPSTPPPPCPVCGH
jgi:hypothetical protein